MQPMQFSTPVSTPLPARKFNLSADRIFAILQTLVEDDSEGQNLEKLGMIEVVFFRGKRSNVRPSVGTNEKLPIDSATGGKISERAKKGEGFMLGAVTTWVIRNSSGTLPGGHSLILVSVKRCLRKSAIGWISLSTQTTARKGFFVCPFDTVRRTCFEHKVIFHVSPAFQDYVSGSKLTLEGLKSERRCRA